LLPRSPRRHPPTQKHPAPLQPHDPGWGDKDGDRTSGDVISHRPGADPEVEVAGEEPARRQRRSRLAPWLPSKRTRVQTRASYMRLPVLDVPHPVAPPFSGSTA